MPSGAKKRKALKKRKQQEAITNNKGFNGDNLHGTFLSLPLSIFMLQDCFVVAKYR